MNAHAIFWKKLALMLGSGVPLTTTLETLAREDLDGALEGVSAKLVSGLEAGLTFAEALEASAAFAPDVIEMVRSAEQNGRLDDVAQAIGERTSDGLLAGASAGREPARAEVAPSLTAETVLSQAMGERASDIHFEPDGEGGAVRFRVDGLLQVRHTLDKSSYKAVIARLKSMARLDVGERRIPQDGRALVEVEGGERIELRIAVGPSTRGEAAMVRVLRKDNILSVLERTEAIFPDPEVRARVFEATERGNGVLMVTGPSGCGKTTSLYCLIAHHDADRYKIISVEEPAEVELPGVHQIQTQPRLGLFYANALRHAMRMDPDVLYCGEIRDSESASILLRAAVTGHLVYSQLHSRSGVDALMRLLDLGMEPYLVADATIGVLAQRLVRRLCPHCAAPSAEATAEVERIVSEHKRLHAPPKGARILAPVGCDRCANTGYLGRRPIQNFLPVDADVRRVISKGPTEAKLEKAARKAGMKSLFARGLDAVYAGETSLAEVMRVCQP